MSIFWSNRERVVDGLGRRRELREMGCVDILERRFGMRLVDR